MQELYSGPSGGEVTLLGMLVVKSPPYALSKLQLFGVHLGHGAEGENEPVIAALNALFAHPGLAHVPANWAVQFAWGDCSRQVS